jgi:Na+/H+ antiporter NhaD/arsenite permease-like protein
MVYAIARRHDVRMPHFFGYMAWSVLILVPTFLFAGWLFFT